MKNTKIEWADHTWNVVRGCTRVSPGCGGPGNAGGCYAEALAARFSEPGLWGNGFAKMTPAGPRWTGKVDLLPDKLLLPLQWRKPARIFVNSTSDTFHQDLDYEQIDKIFAAMALAEWHTMLVLTKRTGLMYEYIRDPRTPERVDVAMNELAPAR